ncbi:hypothetical protein [Lentzea sp. NBRC 102530]|uniref:WXG100-like domain-containing protein n=1 Tax=Lentzea sp. NBRC 102530 TaxID=3032201 RepID=UPI0024A3720F|nr:hypothetical protein [Lentzea sp. NBRC 102530]GLY46794.1 hypothetical protein Lesp01_04500 [Lentzea sp. NBRC 102530]
MSGAEDTTHLPAALQKFFQVVLGMEWPEASEGGLTRLRHAWWDAASAAEDFADLVSADSVALARVLHGELGDQVVDHLRADLATGVAELVAGMRDLSRAAEKAAADVRKAKIMLIAMAALALATVISLLYSLIFSFMIPAVEAAAQVGLRLVLRELAAKLSSLSVRAVGTAAAKPAVDAAKFGAFGAAFMGGLDGGIQLGQIAADQRHGFDWESLKGSVIGGVIGGAAGGVAHGLSRGVVSGLSAQARSRVTGSVRALGHFGYASAQVASAGVSNPLINVATGMRGNVWDGIIGAASRAGGVRTPTTGASGSPDVSTFSVPGIELDLVRNSVLSLEQEVRAAADRVGGGPAPALTSDYHVESAGGAVFAAVKPSDAPAHPEIRVARDGTLAINGWRSVAGAGPVTEAREFFATPEVLDAARKALQRLGSRVGLVVDDTRIVLGDGTRQVLHRVVPRTEALTTDASHDVARVVQNGRPDTLVLGSGERTAFAPMSVDGRDVTGAQHLAEGLVETSANGEAAGLTPGRAAEFAGRAQPGTDGAPLPGRRYAELVANRPLLDQVSRNAGVNQHAWAKPGQMYVAASIPDHGRPPVAGERAHHFATVIAESADGRSQITLENHSRAGESRETVRAAIDAELRHGSGDPALAEALRGVRQTGFDGADPIARARAWQAVVTHLDLPPAAEQWHFRMYTREPGETFFDQHSTAAAPLVTVAAGGLSDVSPVTVGFDQGQRTATADALAGVRATARDVARAAVARADLGLPPPRVTVSGFSAGRTGLADALARGRAENVLAAFQEAAAGELHRLQGNEKTVESIAGHVELGTGHDRTATLEVSFDEPARDARHEVALTYDRVAHGLPELVLAPHDLRSRIEEFDALADRFDHHAPSAGTRDRLTGVNSALAAVTDPVLRNAVRTFVTDALLASTLAPVRETTLRLVPANRLDQLLDDLTTELANGRDPFTARSSPLHGLAAPENAPLPVRLAHLALTNLSPSARDAVTASPLFTALAATPEALTESLFAATGFEEQHFITTCVPAAVNSAVRAKVPTLASLLHIGRSVADTTEHRITRASPEARQKADRLFGRSQETMVRKRIADARAEFTAVEDRALRLVRGEQSPAARQEWHHLTVRWSRTMQKLAAAQLDLPVVPVLTRKVVRGDWTASVAVMSSVFLDRPTRRLTGVDHQNYVGLLQPALAMEPGGHLFGADEVSTERSPAVPLEDELTTPNEVNRFWERVAARGGTVLSSPDHAVHLGTGLADGKRVFALDDPMYARPVVLTPDALLAWAVKQEAAASPALFDRAPDPAGAAPETTAFLGGGTAGGPSARHSTMRGSAARRPARSETSRAAARSETSRAAARRGTGPATSRAQQFPPPPPEVLRWWPTADGPATLREFLQQFELPPGVSPEDTGRGGGLTGAMSSWIRAWAMGIGAEKLKERAVTQQRLVDLSGELVTTRTLQTWLRAERQDVGADGKPLYSAAAAAELSGGVMPAKAVSHIWTTASKGALLQVPEEVLSWRPRPDGAQTLRGVVEQLGLPQGVSLGRDAGGRLNHVVEAWVHAWVDRLRTPENGGGPAIDPEGVAAASGGLITAEQVRDREVAQRPVSHPVPPREIVEWRPSDGTKTLREAFERLDLPPGISLERDGTGKLNAATRSWVEAWVRGFGDRVVDGKVITTGRIAELSGGLVVQNTVSRWLRADRPAAAPREVLGWRPAPDGTGPRTLEEFLGNHPLPQGVTLARKGNGGLVPPLDSWVKEWFTTGVRERVRSTGFDEALAEVTALAGGLVRKEAVDGWVRDIRISALPALPQDVASWRPAADSPRTLRARLDELGLPVHAHWVRDWVKGMWDRLSDDTGLPLTAAEMARMSGGLANAEQVVRWWPRVGAEVAGAAVTPDDVLHWRPARGGPGTLREYLGRRPLPDRVSFETATGRLSLAAEQWVRAWAQNLQGVLVNGEVLTPAAVARLSGDLVVERTVASWWDKPVVVEPPAHVVAWRPGPDGPRNLAEYLAGVDLPPGISFERRAATGNRAPTLVPEAMHWVRRWVADVSREVGVDGRRRTPRTMSELSGGLVAGSTVVRWLRKATEPVPMPLKPVTESAGPRAGKRHLSDDGVAAKRRATVEARLDQGRHETRWEPGDEEVQIVRAVRHDLVPDSAMDHAFPWRDHRDPVGRVYAPFAAEDGSLHPAVRAGADRITARMTGGKSVLKSIAADLGDGRLPDVGSREMERLWPLLEADVVREVRRLVEGSPPDWRAPARPVVLRPDQVRPHEQVLVGRWGLRLSTPDAVPADRPSVSNGRVLGLYLGAVLRSVADEERWGAEHVQFPSYAMQAGGGNFTMTAEGAANFTAFANTGLRADVPSPRYDAEAINAQFVRFVVSLPDGTGKPRKLPVAAMVLLDNAFDPVANRHGIVTVDYGDDYLAMFDQPVKREAED